VFWGKGREEKGSLFGRRKINGPSIKIINIRPGASGLPVVASSNGVI